MASGDLNAGRDPQEGVSDSAANYKRSQVLELSTMHMAVNSPLVSLNQDKADGK